MKRSMHRFVSQNLQMLLRICVLIGLSFCWTNGDARGTSDELSSLLAQARAAMSAGRTAEVVTLYRRVAGFPAVDLDTHRKFARFLARNPETRDEAIKAYRQATILAPQEAALAIEFAAVLVSGGDSVNAVLEYRRAFETTPDNEYAVRWYVNQISRLGATSVAIKQHSDKLGGSPKNLATRLMLAELLRSEARYSDALDHYWLAQQRAPNNLVALRGTAEAWLGLGYHENAAEAFAILGTFDDPEIKGSGLAGRARVLLATEQPEAALRMLYAHHTVITKSASARMALADCYRALGQPTNERTTLEQSLALNPQEVVPVLEKLARNTYESGDKAATQKYCERLIALDLRSAVGAQGLNLNGQSAPPWLEKVADLPSARRAGYEREAGEAAIFWGQPEKALPHLRLALTTLTNSPRLLLTLGDTLLQTKDFDGATAAYILIPDQRFLNALFRLAQSQLLSNKVAPAHDIYRYLLERDTSDFKFLRGYAEVLQRSGDIKQATLVLARLARRAPESQAVNLRLGEFLRALGRSYRTNSTADVVQASSINTSLPDGLLKGKMTVALVEPLLEGGDKVKLKVEGHSEFNGEYRLDEVGFLQLPFLKEPVNARCLTERELSDKIIEQGGKQSTLSTMEITITEYQRASLVIAGAVYLPGSFQVRSPLNLRQSLMLASGATARAGRSVYVLQGAGSCNTVARNSHKGEVETFERAAAENGQIKLKQALGVGDIVFVPETDAAFITGAVAQPGVVQTRHGLTLQAAVKQRGGTLKGARLDQVRLLRLLPDGASRQEFDVNLSAITEGRAGEVMLLQGDVVVIPASEGEDPKRSFAALLRQIIFRAPRPASDPPQNVSQQ